MRNRKLVIRSTLALLAAIVLTAVLALGWFRYHTSDLPDLSALRGFTPAAMEYVTIDVDGRSVPLWTFSKESLGQTLRNAVLAAEGEIDTRGWARRLYEDYTSSPQTHRFGSYSFQTARTLSYRSPSHRTLAELRAAMQIERLFTQDAILTINFRNRCACLRNP